MELASALEYRQIDGLAIGTPEEQAQNFRNWISDDRLEIPSISSQEWKGWARNLRTMGHRLSFKIGQWMLYGEAQFGYSAVKSGAMIGMGPRGSRDCILRARVALLLCNEHPEFKPLPYGAFDFVKSRAIPWDAKVSLLTECLQGSMQLRRFELHVRKWQESNNRLVRPPGQHGTGYKSRVRVFIRFDATTFERLEALAKLAGFQSVDAWIEQRVNAEWEIFYPLPEMKSP